MTEQTKDPIQLAIDALEFYADFDPDRERGLYGEYAIPGVFFLDEGTKAQEALEQIRALQSQPAAAHGVATLYAQSNDERKLNHLQDDYKLSQQQCREQSEEITYLKIELSKTKLALHKKQPLPADKQAALDDILMAKDTYVDFSMDEIQQKVSLRDFLSEQSISTIIAALTAPQPVADLEGLKTECHGAASAQCNHAQHPYKWIDASLDHLHATGRLNTAQQAEEIKALKAAVRDLGEHVQRVNDARHAQNAGPKHGGTVPDYLDRVIDDAERGLKKHAATIEAAKEG